MGYFWPQVSIAAVTASPPWRPPNENPDKVWPQLDVLAGCGQVARGQLPKWKGIEDQQWADFQG